jgi:ketosteroid isomerase-like protein
MTRTLPECVQAFGEAWARRDLALLRALLSPDYIHTDIEGRVLRHDEWLAYVENQAHGSAVTFGDLEVRELGAVGIVTGSNGIAGGSMGRSTIRFTQVWLLLAGEWKRIAFQATQVRG